MATGAARAVFAIPHPHPPEVAQSYRSSPISSNPARAQYYTIAAGVPASYLLCTIRGVRQSRVWGISLMNSF
jgi:TRAP-type mannitol/chloroaromatic compound transport system permease small subunit